MMTFETNEGDILPCQVIGVPGFIPYLFVWTYAGNYFVIYEYTMGYPVSTAQPTLQEAQEEARWWLLHVKLLPDHLAFSPQLNDPKQYGFSRKPE